MKLALSVVVLAGCFTSSPTRPATPPPQAPPPPASKPVDEDPKAVCTQRTDMLGPFKLTAAQAAARRGAQARTYADAPSSLEEAIEVCGVGAQRRWLGRTTCADGSPGQQLGRVGSVGAGGRCGAIIDAYKVRCPEAEYEVYLDMYMCGPDESFR